jgi:hypothetical protein
MNLDNIDYDAIWCSESIENIVNRKHRDTKSAENSLLLLREGLLTNPCPAEVKTNQNSIIVYRMIKLKILQVKRKSLEITASSQPNLCINLYQPCGVWTKF